jgi:hypothetical protein
MWRSRGIAVAPDLSMARAGCEGGVGDPWDGRSDEESHESGARANKCGYARASKEGTHCFFLSIF